MDEFRGVLDQYTDLNSRLDNLNKQVYQLREQRKIKELELIDFLKQPQFSQFNVIERPDGSKLSIKRPQTWSKAWSLSKGDLYRLLREYFDNAGEKRADLCYSFITRAIDRDSKSNEFKIELK
jgi:hypothetical protein